METKEIGLCHRCDHRANFLEGGSAPRAQCKTEGFTSFSCYAYKPVRPLVISNKPDHAGRQPTGGLLGGRMSPSKVREEMELDVKIDDQGLTYFWKFKDS